MRLRHQYLIAGVAWAFLLGPAAFLLLFGFAAGASWLWLFGDNPWPTATQWALPLIGAIGAAMTALACVLIAYEYGKARETGAGASSRTERRKVLILAVFPLAIILLVGLNSWRDSQKYAKDMEMVAQREAAFAALAGARYRITDITIDRSEQDRFHATVRMNGEREGNYHLHWQVADTGFGATLASGDETIALRTVNAQAEINFTVDQLTQSYQTKVLKGRADVLVQEPFELDAWLVPILSEDERAALPPGEQRRLGKLDSPLQSKREIRFPVRFIIRKAGTGR